MQNNQSSYASWSWIVALLLALILLWMLLTGKGPSNACCNAIGMAAPTAEVMPTEDAPVVTEAFYFSATEHDFTSSGDADQITWAGADIGGLKALLAGNIKAEGDDVMVALTGNVLSEEARQQIEFNAQAFFGPDVTVDNQITVTALTEELPVIAAPTAAKLYFNTGVHRLPSDSSDTLDPVIRWLNNNVDSKAVISGFHDSTGNPESNIRLAKKRAESAYNALLNAGIDAERVEMRKPESTEGNGNFSEARRVEVSIE